jgi:hypothetical protein
MARRESIDTTPPPKPASLAVLPLRAGAFAAGGGVNRKAELIVGRRQAWRMLHHGDG